MLLPKLPPWPLPVLALPAAGLLLWRGWRWPAAFVLGAALAALHASHALSIQLSPALERTDLEVSGRIVGLPVHEPRRTRFEFRVEHSDARHEVLRGRLLRLSWYDDDPVAPEALRAGQRWRFAARVRAPRGLRNPGGFDGEKHALARRIAANGYVRDPARAQRLTAASGLDAWRETMSARIAVGVPSPTARFVRALALGDTRGLDDADWSLLRANGLTHLIAISGFHVGLVAGFAALLAAALWWLLPGLGRRFPRPVAAAMAGFGGAAVYAAAAGFALPTVRTLLMIAVVAAMRTWRRRFQPAATLAIAAIAILLVDPLSVLSAGFWLSFSGVAWLLWCLPGYERRPLRGFLSAQAVATVGLLPLGVALFGQASLAGPVANLVAVPWWSLVVVPLSLAGTGLEAVHAGAGTWAWRWAAYCFDLSWPLFEWLGASPLAVRWLPESRWFALPMALLGAFWLLLPRGVPARPLALLLWLPLLLPARNLPGAGEVELHVLDVGQGLAVVVRTAGHTLLYDMGPAVRDGYDAGERAVVPALRALGVSRLDRAVVSHADNDHVGGLEAVAREYRVVAPFAPAGADVRMARPCVAGEGWRWDGVGFRFLHPTPHFPYLRNEASCVLRIETRHGAALLTGDIGEVIERGLVRRAADALRAEVVLVAHHGSGASSDPGFVAATAARHAIVSTGFGNRFGHPKPAVLDRWQVAGAEVHDTALAGALQVRIGGDGVDVNARRATQPRLWDAEARRLAARAGR
ncbi:DNA internalization-related competence protein ComEC/Rec2 [Marilutibacter chinensis]|uniref:DNA internalization-related competence protein ComEC/Rec2 n=1 Tax=Marilutibacter chinensis TaxID=2912247 RepID=A0ABS9HQ03_9GAMM|nr:DNA internalization-related competence protein ComEC/Rec2 [Lysobacter chinensis]MCF7220586.1 DNA internalization-related competence protein ComEC/Rec2 [Lysobacter chinensis]